MVAGAGIAGITCARALSEAGHRVVVHDTGRRPGGRLALRRYGEGNAERVVDIGGSYFTTSDPAFAAVAADWEARGLAHPWTDTFTAIGGEKQGARTGPVRWSAPGGLRSLVADHAAGLDVRQSSPVASVRVDDGRPVVDGEVVDAVVLAMPDPQARRLLPEDHWAHAALDDPYLPSLALTAGWAERTWPDEHGWFVNEHPDIDWIADDGSRRGDGAPVLVAHATAERARQHLAEPASAAEAMIAAVRDVLPVPQAEPSLVHVQRWTFARPANTREERHALGDDLVGLCGDSWGPRSSVEQAFLSGRSLAAALLERL